MFFLRTALGAALVLFATVAAGCSLEKEPLRAGWLTSGVYAYPATPRCAPPRPPGVPYPELTRWNPPVVSGSGSVSISLPWLGGGPLAARASGAGTTTSRQRVSGVAPRPMVLLDERATTVQVPGFVSAVDLRPYARIAFVADTSGWMCDYARCNGEETSNLPAPLLQAMGDQIDAAVAGLRSDQSFVVYAGSAWSEKRFAPMSPAGRGLAGEFIRGQVCTGARGVRMLLKRATIDRPDVIVLMTSGELQPHNSSASYERQYESCGVAPSYLYCYVDDATENVDMMGVADGARLPPVVAVTVKRHGARWLQNLAEATGGAYVDAAP